MAFTKKVASRKDMIIAIAGSLTVLILLDLSPLGGNVATYAKWMQCGQRPVYARQGPGIGIAGVPNYASAPTFGFMKGFMPRYCTPREAELDGYSADSIKYEFPYLSNEERLQAINKARAIQSRD